MRKILLIIFASLFTLHGHGHGLQAMLSHYSTENGLTSNAVSDIIQDKDGYIWISTWNGLCRYDGYHFFNYTTGTASGIPFLHNRILEIAADTECNIWMRMYDNRIFVLNRRTDCIENPFRNIKNGSNFISTLPITVSNDGHIYSYVQGKGIYQLRLSDQHIYHRLFPLHRLEIKKMVIGNTDQLWLVTTKGLAALHVKTGKIEWIKVMLSKNISAMTLSRNTLYIGTHSGELFVLSPTFPYHITRHVSLGKEPISSLNVDSHGIIWYTTQKEGISRYNPANGSRKDFTQEVPAPESDTHGATLYEFGNLLWAKMNHGGFGYYDRKHDVFEYFYNSPDNSWNLSNTVATYLALPEGVLWMSTNRRGLEKLELMNERIRRQYVAPDSKTFGINEVRGMLYDPIHRQTILSNKRGDVFFYQGTKGTKPVRILHLGGRIYGLSCDHEGGIWISNKDKGLFLYKGNTIHHFTSQDRSKFHLNSDAVYETVQDRKGNIWVATYGGGVNLIRTIKEVKGKLYIPFLNRNNWRGMHYPSKDYQKVRTICQGPEGNIWAGTTDGILILTLHGKKGVSATPLQQTEEKGGQLANNDIIQIVRAHDGSLWIATNGGGLCHTLGKDKEGKWRFETFNQESGLPSDEIRGITFSKNGDVWFSSDQNICSYDIQKKLLTNFTMQDGVGGVACSEGSAITLPNGKMLFGTLNGYYIVDRSKLTTQKGSMLRLQITDFFVNDQLMSPRLNKTYDYYVPDSNYVRLPSRTSVFAFRFASLNYQLQHRVHYQYMLEGYDDIWKNVDATRSVSFSDIPAGTYQFRVKAFLLESPGKYDERTMTVVVPPYLFASTTALLIYFFLTIIGISFFLYWRGEIKRRQIEQMRVLKVGPQEIAFQRDDDYEFVKKLLDWLELHYSDSNMKVEDMVSQSRLSRTSFYNQLKTLTGLSPKEFVSDFRLKKAMMYLEKDTCTIAEVAYNTGFNDPVYFARIFKQKTGLTPKQYRQDPSSVHSQGGEEQHGT